MSNERTHAYFGLQTPKDSQASLALSLNIHVIDHLDETPIAGATLSLRIEAQPRWRPHEALVGDGRRDGSPSPIKIGATRTIALLRLSSDTSGRAKCITDLSGINWGEDTPPDSICLTATCDTNCDGLRTTTMHQEYLNDTPRAATHVIRLDFAKSLVGHTTADSARLWFCLHGNLVSNGQYKCLIQSRRNAPPDLASKKQSTKEPRISIQRDPVTLQDLPVVFDIARAMTSIVDVTGLTPGEEYTYRLVLESQGPNNVEPRRRQLASGTFRTAANNSQSLKVAFASCHSPAGPRTIDRWEELALRGDYELLLLLGDQIYEDNIMYEGSTWFDRYVSRYNAYWSLKCMRQVLRRVPTYMMLDDHEVMDDWGASLRATDPRSQDGRELRVRVSEALRAYSIFQQSHSPLGYRYGGQLHYSFKRGPASWFVFDLRSQRGFDPDYPILGQAQFNEFEAWARSPDTNASDIIVVACSVPIATLPVELMRRVAKKAAENLGCLAGLVLGPPGCLLGAWIAGQIYDSQEPGLLNENDILDRWNYSPNQCEMVRVLDVLGDLGNYDMSTGAQKPKAVFVLGGDVHMGMMHAILSRDAQRHNRNPFIYQLTSSPISRAPAPTLKTALEDKMGRLASTPGGRINLEAAEQQMRSFILDDATGAPWRYSAETLVEPLYERNYGHLEVHRLSGGGRAYEVNMSLLGSETKRSVSLRVDLDAPLIAPIDVATGRPLVI